MARHELFDCPLRLSECLKCGLKVPARDLRSHEELECSRRSGACPNVLKGCGEVMSHDLVESHVTHK